MTGFNVHAADRPSVRLWRGSAVTGHPAVPWRASGDQTVDQNNLLIAITFHDNHFTRSNLLC
jgi:hypothetical protein